MASSLILLAVLAVAIIGRANSVAIASGLLLIIKLLQTDRYIFPIIEKQGLFWGLVLLLMAILIPIANGKISQRELFHTSISWVGLWALIFSLMMTYLSGLGLKYLTIQGHADLMPALIIGTVIAAAFLGGVPVGPLITSGVLALVMKVFSKGN
jgi:uncharacterized membrane protein (DUF441 family)